MTFRCPARRAIAAAAVLLAAAAGQAQAQTYPANKITIIVAFAPGGIAEIGRAHV